MKQQTISSSIALWLMIAALVSACGTGVIYNSDPGNDGPVCGNSVVETGETCDTAIAAGQMGACPTDCDDSDQCTVDSLQNADTCTAVCSHTSITTCVNDDGCCPVGCNFLNDSDCGNPCGNGVVDSGETCDIAIAAGQTGACPQTCNDGDTCTRDTLQNAGTCLSQCSHTHISACVGNDGCCPTGCNKNNDYDCNAVCGNGVVEAGETCDPPSSCPMSCNDGNPCTVDTVTGSFSNCDVACIHQTITQCTSGDGCCPPGCNTGNDSDCNTVCGDGAVTGGETCDTAIAAGGPGACPTSCNDGIGCTSDTLQNPGTCRALCVFTAITACASNDGCCPTGCNANNDNNCSPVCGNGVVESGEICDTGIAAGQTGACPTQADCNDHLACTTDALQNGGTCLAACTHSTVTACLNGDGCCPTGCTPSNDSDCINLTGTWISRITTQGTMETPLGTDTNATIDLIERTVITKSGSTITARFDICKLSTTGTISDAAFSINYSSVLRLFTTSPTEPDFPAYVGGAVSFPNFVIMTGWNTAGNSVDSDSDGNPGITLPITSGSMSADAYTGLTITTIVENMTLQTASTIAGTIDFSANGHIFDAYYSAFNLHTGDLGPLTVTPSSDAVAVNLIKLAGTVTCAIVLTHCTGAICVP